MARAMNGDSTVALELFGEGRSLRPEPHAIPNAPRTPPKLPTDRVRMFAPPLARVNPRPKSPAFRPVL